MATRDPFQPKPEPKQLIDALLIGGPCAGLRPVPPDELITCLDTKTMTRAAYRRSTCEALSSQPGVTAYRFAGMRR